MTQRIDKEQESSIYDIPLAADIGQEHGKNRHGAGCRDNAEKQAQKESSQGTSFPYVHRLRKVDVELKEAQKVKTHDQADSRHKIFPEGADISQHPAHQSGDQPQDGERDRKPEDKKG